MIKSAHGVMVVVGPFLIFLFPPGWLRACVWVTNVAGFLTVETSGVNLIRIWWRNGSTPSGHADLFSGHESFSCTIVYFTLLVYDITLLDVCSRSFTVNKLRSAVLPMGLQLSLTRVSVKCTH